MESAIIQFHGVREALFALIYDKLVVQAELAFRHAGEVSSHEDVSIHVGSQNIAYAKNVERPKRVIIGNAHLWRSC